MKLVDALIGYIVILLVFVAMMGWVLAVVGIAFWVFNVVGMVAVVIGLGVLWLMVVTYQIALYIGRAVRERVVGPRR